MRLEALEVSQEAEWVVVAAVNARGERVSFGLRLESKAEAHLVFHVLETICMRVSAIEVGGPDE